MVMRYTDGLTELFRCHCDGCGFKSKPLPGPLEKFLLWVTTKKGWSVVCVNTDLTEGSEARCYCKKCSVRRN